MFWNLSVQLFLDMYNRHQLLLETNMYPHETEIVVGNKVCEVKRATSRTTHFQLTRFSIEIASASYIQQADHESAISDFRNSKCF